jgi:hypothetical protein
VGLAADRAAAALALRGGGADDIGALEAEFAALRGRADA